MITMKANIVNFAGNAFLAGSGGGGAVLALKWLGEHASGIGALAVIIGIVLGSILKIKAHVLRNKELALKEKEHQETVRHNKAIEAKTIEPKD